MIACGKGLRKVRNRHLGVLFNGDKTSLAKSQEECPSHREKQVRSLLS